MDKKTFYWLAGILEGEGSFLCGPPSRPTMSSIRLLMTDKDIVDRVAALLGVKTLENGRRHPNWKIPYTATLKGSRAVELMKKLKPIMGARRQGQIQRAIDSYKKDPRLKLNMRKAEAIRRRIAKGETHSRIARDYGIDRATVSYIGLNQSWVN